MSQENVEIIRQAFEAYDSGDPSAFLDLYDPDIVLRVEPPFVESGTYHGAQEVEHWYTRFFGSFGASYRMELKEVIEAGDSVVAIHQPRARGRSSGAEVRSRSVPVIFTMRGGKVIRIDHPASRQAALEAVGLSEQDARADS
jgi:ketosteroid isomerase-like protein